MIGHLRGRLLAKYPQQAIIEAGGVGYDVVISVPTFSALPSEGTEVALFIHTHVREDTLALYGFLDREEKRVFERLITVSGVGPKLAVTIMSGLSTERLVAAIRGHDHATLSQIPGIGKRLAERLVVDLKKTSSKIWLQALGRSTPAHPPRTCFQPWSIWAINARSRKKRSPPRSLRTRRSRTTSRHFSGRLLAGECGISNADAFPTCPEMQQVDFSQQQSRLDRARRVANV